MGDFTNQLMSSIFSPQPGPLRSKENSYNVPRRTTNPNSRPASRGKTAKSKRRRAMEAQNNTANLANQQQMQKDQFQFLKDNIFDKSGATRRTMSGQIEQPQPQGLDFFKTSGADRPEVIARKAALDAQGLNQPGVWEGAQAAVNRQKKVQGWADANTPPPQAPPNVSQNQALRMSGGGVEVFDNPAFNQVNPRTGLTQNAGPFVRSVEIDPKYQAGGQTGRAFFPGQGQPAPAKASPAPVPTKPAVSTGSVQDLFQPPPAQELFIPGDNLTPPSKMWNNTVAEKQPDYIFDQQMREHYKQFEPPNSDPFTGQPIGNNDLRMQQFRSLLDTLLPMETSNRGNQYSAKVLPRTNNPLQVFSKWAGVPDESLVAAADLFPAYDWSTSGAPLDNMTRVQNNLNQLLAAGQVGVESDPTVTNRYATRRDRFRYNARPESLEEANRKKMQSLFNNY